MGGVGDKVLFGMSEVAVVIYIVRVLVGYVHIFAVYAISSFFLTLLHASC